MSKSVGAFMKRLEEISAARQMLAADPNLDAARVHLALMVYDDATVAGSRDTLAMSFEPGSQQPPPNPGERQFLALAARFGASPEWSLGMGIEILETELELSTINPFAGLGLPTAPDVPDKTTVSFMLGHPGKTPPCLPARLKAAQLWSLVDVDTSASSVFARLEGIVLGTKLARNEAPPSFSHPGSGGWTLFRVVLPGEAFIAINWERGALELFPKQHGVRTRAGEAIFHAF